MSEVLAGSPAGTIYGTYAAAVIHIDSQFGDAYRAWEALAVADRKRALLGAAAYLDRISWVDDYDTFAERDALAAFVTASYELAALAAEDASILAASDQGSNIARVYAGGAGVDFFNPTSTRLGSASKLPPILQALIGEHLASTEAATVFGGTGSTGDCENPFSACEDYDRTDPH